MAFTMAFFFFFFKLLLWFFYKEQANSQTLTFASVLRERETLL